jgi:hypothetical protein
MKESVIYQDIIAKGEQQGAIKLILRQVSLICRELAPNVISKVRGLPLEQLEELGEALLDFQTEEDLRKWLDGYTNEQLERLSRSQSQFQGRNILSGDRQLKEKNPKKLAET